MVETLEGSRGPPLVVVPLGWMRGIYSVEILLMMESGPVRNM